MAHELGALADKALAAMDDLLAEMGQHEVPGPVSQRFKEVVAAACMHQRAHAKQIARFKRSDFE